MSDDGSVTVVDAEGNARFTDSGDSMTVNALVEEFLTDNSYFRVAGPWCWPHQYSTKTQTRSLI